MDAPLKSSSESLRSGDSSEMELSVMEESPPRSETPLNDTLNSLNADTDNIVVHAPSMMPNGTTIVDGEDDDEEVVTPFHKRKRTSVNYNLDDGYGKVMRGSPNFEPTAKRSKLSQKIRGVIIGVWRDSDQPDDADKHVIYGFIDIHDRLRTRIYGMNRRGQELIANVPTGAGGCWVTFERIIFDPHLRSLSAAEIKEYVKLRTEMKVDPSEEEKLENDTATVEKAKAAVVAQEALSPGSKPVVHRPPRNSLGRQSLPRQNLHKTPSFQAVNAADIQTPKPSPFSEGKPIGVLLGYWADSTEERDEDKHAVFGVLSGTDCFRVKVARQTRDGRYLEGNFPIGAGALWLHYDKVVLEPHLRFCSRPEVKEYCRIRQRELEHRESEKERKNNELKAVQQAKTIVAEMQLNGTNVDQDRISPEPELRHSARSEHRVSRQQTSDVAAAERLRKAEIREREHEKSRKEVAMAEALVHGAAQQELKHNIKKLNKVWVAQQAATIPGVTPPASAENEVKYHNGIKYERKQNGPFLGKLVSPPQILSIDGEDYVEYRILTKPSF